MKIESAEIRYVELPLISPWRTAYGEDATIHSVIVRLAGGGQVAWGESTPFYAPTYSPESAHSAYWLAKEFYLPRLVGEVIDTVDALLDRLAVFKGNPFPRPRLRRRGGPFTASFSASRSGVCWGARSPCCSVVPISGFRTRSMSFWA